MALFYQHNINHTTRLGVWHITETEDFFLKEVSLLRNITHPHKRLQHLAGRYLLRLLFPDFPHQLIHIADTRKPYLPGEEYHFSISHCGVGEPVKECDLPTLPTPEYLDWNMWIGPSLYRGYNPTLSPPIEDESWAWWRGYKGFGGDYITDWGAHMFDIVQWALGMDASGPVAFTPPETPGAKEGLFYTYANGVKVNHKQWGEGNAIQFIGTEGTLEVARSFIRSNPANIATLKLKPSDKKVYFSDNHQQDWINAIKKRSLPIADVEIGHRTATICNAVNIAYELQRPLKWDPVKEKFDNEFANLMISRPYRAPWNFRDF